MGLAAIPCAAYMLERTKYVASLYRWLIFAGIAEAVGPALFVGAAYIEFCTAFFILLCSADSSIVTPCLLHLHYTSLRKPAPFLVLALVSGSVCGFGSGIVHTLKMRLILAHFPSEPSFLRAIVDCGSIAGFIIAQVLSNFFFCVSRNECSFVDSLLLSVRV